MDPADYATDWQAWAAAGLVALSLAGLAWRACRMSKDNKPDGCGDCRPEDRDKR